MRKNLKVVVTVGAVMAIGSGAAMAQLALDERLQHVLEAPLSSSEVLVDRAQLTELEEGGTQEFVFRIDPSEKYTIYGGCDDDCWDINLVARNAAGAIIDSDEEDDDEPLVRILPGQSGNEVRVTLSPEGCETSHCIAGVSMFRAH